MDRLEVEAGRTRPLFVGDNVDLLGSLWTADRPLVALRLGQTRRCMLVTGLLAGVCVLTATLPGGESCSTRVVVRGGPD